MNIDDLLKNYTANQTTVDTLEQTKIVLLVGIVAAGKDTLQKQLLNLSGYRNIVTCTTRQPRVNNGIIEQDGVDYHFLTKEQMREKLENHEMIEVNKFGENFYGTHIDEFKNAQVENKIALGDIDINGIASFRKLAPESVTAILVVPPDYNAWRERLNKRYSSREVFENEWHNRRNVTINELDHALSVPYYHFIINDDLERAVRVTDEIAKRGDSFNRHDDEARLVARDLRESIVNAD